MDEKNKPKFEVTEISIADEENEPQITIKKKVTLLDVFHKLELVAESQDNFEKNIKCVRDNVQDLCGLVSEHDRLIAEQKQFCVDKQVKQEQEETHAKKFSNGYQKGETDQLKKIKDFLWFLTKMLAVVTGLAFIFSWIVGLWG